MLATIPIALMLLYVLSKKRVIGALAWITFAFFWLYNVPHYLEISDYFNVGVMIAAFSIFTIFGLTILRDKNEELYIQLTSLAFISAIIYFTFALSWLKDELIKVVAYQTVILAKVFGFNFNLSSDIIENNGKYVQIILACTGIESIALFAGISFGIKASFDRKMKAFLVSVPIIYILNLLRNVFIVAAYSYSWFGEDSFYVAHHVISKTLATLALILISMEVFKILPEFSSLLFSLKDSMVKVWSLQEKD